jgi:hypothetical protein
MSRPFVEWESTERGFAHVENAYSVRKFRIRRQVALYRRNWSQRGTAGEIAAYFRNEAEALEFARAFNLEIVGYGDCEDTCQSQCIGVCGVGMQP